MSYINFKYVQAAADGLLGQISVLEELKDELEQTEYQIKDMAYMDGVRAFLSKGQGELEEEIITLKCFVKCLEEVVHICKITDQNIADTYNLEKIICPQTVFGISKITGFKKYEHLLFFRGDDGG